MVRFPFFSFWKFETSAWGKKQKTKGNTVVYNEGGVCHLFVFYLFFFGVCKKGQENLNEAGDHLNHPIESSLILAPLHSSSHCCFKTKLNHFFPWRTLNVQKLKKDTEWYIYLAFFKINNFCGKCRHVAWLMYVFSSNILL